MEEFLQKFTRITKVQLKTTKILRYAEKQFVIKKIRYTEVHFYISIYTLYFVLCYTVNK